MSSGFGARKPNAGSVGYEGDGSLNSRGRQVGGAVSKAYPYTIDNGGGERLTFVGVTRGPDGERLPADGVAQPGAGPPMHVHYLQEEAVRVVKFRDAPAPIPRNRRPLTLANQG